MCVPGRNIRIRRVPLIIKNNQEPVKADGISLNVPMTATLKQPQLCPQEPKISTSSTPPSHPVSSYSSTSSSNQMKIYWDVLTIFLSITVGLYTTHASMRDQCFPHLLNNNCITLNRGKSLPLFFGYFHGSTVVTLYDLWRVMDIVLNFATDRKRCRQLESHDIMTTSCDAHRKHTSSCCSCASTSSSGTKKTNNSRGINQLSYLTTWFLIDVITLLSWEVLYVQPVFNHNIRKNIFVKATGIVRVYPIVRRQLKKWPFLLRILCRAISFFAGNRFWNVIRKLIRYAPKYIDFACTGKMKVIVALRLLRQARLVRSVMRRGTRTGTCSSSSSRSVVTRSKKEDGTTIA